MHCHEALGNLPMAAKHPEQVVWDGAMLRTLRDGREIYRYYPLQERRELVERLLDRGVLDTGDKVSKQPGRCCPVGCQVPETPHLEGPKTRVAAE